LGHSFDCGSPTIITNRAISGSRDVLDCAPHSRKKLYDNSQLDRVSLHVWQVTGNGFFRTITEEILDHVVGEMTDPMGGFYSTQDADSEGKEGKFFVWTPAEIRVDLSASDSMSAIPGSARPRSYQH
jgi:uncharacterized protein YyaL (SSP411 family)